jgi:nucleoside-diphosphate-sugar epimerase
MKPASHSNFEQPPRVLLTGIDSFTGQHLKHHLEQSGYSVFGTRLTPSPNPTEYPCDITDKHAIGQILALTRPHYLIHLAGISYVNHPIIEDYYRINLLGSQNLLDALCESGLPIQKVILASSATVYGSQAQTTLDESLCPRPTQHYAISKLAMEHRAQAYYSRLPLLITRPFNYTGPGQPEHFVIPKIIAHYKRRAPRIELCNGLIKLEGMIAFTNGYFGDHYGVNRTETKIKNTSHPQTKT